VIHSINSLARKRAAIVQPNKPAKACIDVEQAIRERLPILPTKASVPKDQNPATNSQK
jgi:hypothetical protein